MHTGEEDWLINTATEGRTRRQPVAVFLHLKGPIPDGSDLTLFSFSLSAESSILIVQAKLFPRFVQGIGPALAFHYVFEAFCS